MIGVGDRPRGKQRFLVLSPILVIVIFGLIFALTYKKTASLRAPVVAHSMADLFGISVAVFLNLWTPPGSAV
jgi:membrane protease YdiL (CAAX protease family)